MSGEKPESRKIPHGFRELTLEEKEDAFKKIKGKGTIFREISDKNLKPLVDEMFGRELVKGEVLLKQGEPTEMYASIHFSYFELLNLVRAHVRANGVLQRTRMEEDHFHIIDEQGSIRDVYSSLHLLNKEPTYATVTCESGTLYFPI